MKAKTTHFGAVLTSILSMEQIDLSDLWRRCNQALHAKGDASLSRATLYSYINGRMPKAPYAKLIIEQVSDRVERRTEVAVAYLRDMAEQLGHISDEISISALRKDLDDLVLSLPEELREQLITIGRGCMQVEEMKMIVEQTAAIYSKFECRSNQPKPLLKVAEPKAEYKTRDKR